MNPEHKADLEIARYLAENGVPIFLAKMATRDDGGWDASGGSGGTGYKIPVGWQNTVADPSVIDEWEPGMAVCAVMGHTVDLFDVDPRSGGELSFAKLTTEGIRPKSYGRQTTPSGGSHDFIASLGIRSRDKILPGIDIKAGDADGNGRGFAFLAPTKKRSKVDGVTAYYQWATPPQLEELVLIGADDSGAGLAELIAATQAATESYVGPVYDGKPYSKLDKKSQRWADDYVEGRLKWWRELFAEAVEWDDSETDDKRRGWELLTRDFAWTMALLTAWPWTGIDEDRARELYDEILPDELANTKECRNKFTLATLKKAARGVVPPPPWDDFPDEMQPSDRVRPQFEVTSAAEALQQMRSEIGRSGTPLAGVFKRNGSLVFTPRVGEEGYSAPENPSNQDGPAQVRTLAAGNFDILMDYEYHVFKTVMRRDVPSRIVTLFPERVSRRVVAADVDAFNYVRPLKGVTHTPIVRRDGSMLWNPGYDDMTGLLYLPEPGLEVPELGKDVTAAKQLLDEMLGGFPWVSEHDEANYLAALLTPLLRDLVPPPYKLIAIGAPQPGSGKSLLARLIRTIHGGVFRSEFPRSNEEISKQITSILDTTSAPVVQWDNVTGILKSSVLDGLLSSAVWSDRMLGHNRDIVADNDRLWVITGNNLAVGGDLSRRTLWVTIDAQMEHPETRTDFTHPDLVRWLESNRGAVLAALLTLVKSWVDGGKVVKDLVTTDDFGLWVQVTGGILSYAGYTGTVGHQDSIRQPDGMEEAEWANFLREIEEEYQSAEWTVRELTEKIQSEEIDPEMVPEEIIERVHRQGLGASRFIGKWFMNRKDRWAGGYAVHQVPSKNRAKWWVEQK